MGCTWRTTARTASSTSPAARSPARPRRARGSRWPAGWSAAAPSTDEALTSAVEAATDGEGLGIVRALLEQGAVDADLLRRAATDQSVDAVFDLLRWRDGDFAFVMDEANPDDVGVALAVESVLADTEARRADAGSPCRRSCPRRAPCS